MSKTLINQYYSKVDKLIQFGGSKKETSIRNEFYNLLGHYAEKKNLILVAELAVRGTKGRDVTPDGTLSTQEWALDLYTEKKPSNTTIVEKINTFSFADYDMKAIDLLQRMCTVSVETMKIVEKMEKEKAA